MSEVNFVEILVKENLYARKNCQSIIIRGLCYWHYVDNQKWPPHSILDACVISIASYMCVSRLNQEQRRGISSDRFERLILLIDNPTLCQSWMCRFNHNVLHSGHYCCNSSLSSICLRVALIRNITSLERHSVTSQIWVHRRLQRMHVVL